MLEARGARHVTAPLALQTELEEIGPSKIYVSVVIKINNLTVDTVAIRPRRSESTTSEPRAGGKTARRKFPFLRLAVHVVLEQLMRLVASEQHLESHEVSIPSVAGGRSFGQRGMS